MEVIHVCGHSCVGKRTLIQRLADPTQAAIRTRFGIVGSVSAFGPKPEEAFTTIKWYEPVSLFSSTVAEHLLHKWQFATHYLLSPIKAARSDLVHRIILLRRDEQDLAERIKRRSLWNPPPSALQLQIDWNRLIVPNFRVLADAGWDIEVVNAGTDLYHSIGLTEQ